MLPTQQSNAAAAAAPFQSASLYVGDLHNEVTESLLFELYNRVGPVASIRVCRDSVTRRSLGYAYVNFHNVQDAERALDTMNFTEIKGKPCRIMWSQRDPSLRKSGVGNVFVRNLAPSVDNKGLYDTFSVFGNILSCKVATDEQGFSKGYGYVHFETAEAAQDAIQKFNGTLIDDVEVHVGSFVKRQDRAGQNDWTNLYVKQFPTSWDEAKLKEIFSVYGNVTNVAIARDQDGKSKAFGYVNFSDHESAAKALAELANKTFPVGEVAGEEEKEKDENGSSAASPQTFELYVSRMQKKSERQREMKAKQDALNQERVSKYQGMNLYVKNISDSITDENFREAFAPFGTITSARIMRDSSDQKISKGFGFICYSSPEEATRAVTEMNGKVIGNKPLVVTLHQRKEHRRAHLAATYAPQNMGMRFPQGMGMGIPQGMGIAPPFMGMYLPQPGQPQGQPNFNQQRGGGPGPGLVGGPNPYPYGPMGGNSDGRGGAGGGGGGNAGSPRNMYPGGPQGVPGRPGFYPGNPQFFQQGPPQGQQQQSGLQQQQQPPQQQGQQQGMGGPNAGFKGRGPIPGSAGGYPGQQGLSPQGGQGGQRQGGPVLQQQQQQSRPSIPGPQPQQQQPGPGQVGGMGLVRPQVPQQGPVGVGGIRGNMYPGQPGPNPMQQQQLLQQQQQGRGVPQPNNLGVKFNNQARNQLPLQQQQQLPLGYGGPQQQLLQQQQPQPGKLDFSDASLASADPLTQKNMIGELLYPLIYQHQPEQAGKITGMLLEMDNGELLNLIESPDALQSKIEEALAVLRNHKPSDE